MNINQRVRNFVTKECAHHEKILNDIKNYCDREFTKSLQCILFLEDNARCGYFEKAVLPMNPPLEALYQAKHKAEQIGFQLTEQDKKQILETESSVINKVNIHCKRCNKMFLANNYRSQYCEECKKFLNKEYQKNWLRQKRGIRLSMSIK
jgi:hypothetical protein